MAKQTRMLTKILLLLMTMAGLTVLMQPQIS